MSERPPRIQPAKWRAIRAEYATDLRITLRELAERHAVPLTAIRKRSAREKWRERRPQYAPLGPPSPRREPVAVVTAGDFSRALAAEVSECLALCAEVREAEGYDAADRLRLIVPALEKIARIGESIFGEPAIEAPRPQTVVNVGLMSTCVPRPIRPIESPP